MTHFIISKEKIAEYLCMFISHIKPLRILKKEILEMYKYIN